MDITIVSLILSLLCIINLMIEVKGDFNWGVGNAAVYLSAIAYCDINTYLTRNFTGRVYI